MKKADATAYRHEIFTSAKGEAAVMADFDAVLAQWPAPHHAMFVPTRHGRTWVVSTGDTSAPYLVLLHGAGSHAMSWVADVPTYTRHFRTHVVDTPGDPGRSEPVRSDWNSPAYAEWLSDVLDGLGVERTSLVGISQGGWNAMRFAMSAPHRVDRLALLAPAGITPPRLSFLLTALPLTALGTSGRRLIDHRILAGGPFPGAALTYVDHLATYFKPRVGVPPIFTDEELRQLQMPLLVVVGERDVIFSAPRVAGRIVDVLPHAAVTILPAAGHALLNTAEDVTAFLLADPIDHWLP